MSSKNQVKRYTRSTASMLTPIYATNVVVPEKSLCNLNPPYELKPSYNLKPSYEFKQSYELKPSYEFKPLYEVNIDFDDSIKQWNMNKKRVGHEYKYICENPSKKCNRSCHETSNYCYIHRKCEVNSK